MEDLVFNLKVEIWALVVIVPIWWHACRFFVESCLDALRRDRDRSWPPRP